MVENLRHKDSSKLLERKFYRLCRNQVNSGMFIETQGRRISYEVSLIQVGPMTSPNSGETSGPRRQASLV